MAEEGESKILEKGGEEGSKVDELKIRFKNPLAGGGDQEKNTVGKIILPGLNSNNNNFKNNENDNNDGNGGNNESGKLELEDVISSDDSSTSDSDSSTSSESDSEEENLNESKVNGKGEKKEQKENKLKKKQPPKRRLVKPKSSKKDSKGSSNSVSDHSEFHFSDKNDDKFGDEYNNNIGEITKELHHDDDDKKKHSKEEVKEDEVDLAVKKLKARTKRKTDGFNSDAEREEFVHDLLMRMDAAFETDLNLQRKGQLPFEKLKMLDEVVQNLKKSSLQLIFLERNVLLVLGQWLRPSPVDNSLTDLKIRTTIYDLLPSLPIETDHLKRATFGKVISYLKDSDKETESNKIKLRKLIEIWAGMIYGKTDNFRMLESMQHMKQHSRHEKNEPEPNAANVSSAGQKRKMVSPSLTPKTPKSLDFLTRRNTNTSASDSDANQMKNTSERAKIPRQQEFNFKRRVTGNLSSVVVGRGSGRKSAGAQSQLEKKIKSISVKKGRR